MIINMPSIQKVIMEAIIVGIVLIPITYIAGFIAKRLVGKPALPEICRRWNDYYIMEVNLFIAGFLFHIISEYAGVNKWYAQQYIG
jgi:predicted alpha/beta hydrolase